MSTPRAREVIIGLDAGTSAVKAVAFELAGAAGPSEHADGRPPASTSGGGLERVPPPGGAPWRHVASRDHPLLAPSEYEEVQDPETILRAAGEVLAECVAASAGARVVAISVSCAMHGLIALDEQVRPLTPLITWADGRARAQARSLHEAGRALALHELTGVPVHPMTPMTKLMWFAEHDQRTLAAARWWAGLKDYVLWWLTGTVATELSSACGTGLLDLAVGRWSAQAAKLCGVAPEQLPPILATTSVLELGAAAARRIGLPAGTPVVAGAGDGPLGNLGTGAMRPGVAGLSLGTSGAVRVAADEPGVRGGRVPFCFALTDSSWVLGDAMSTGASVTRWAAAALAPDVAAGASAGTSAAAAVMELAAGVPPGSAGLVMVPYLLPERGPLWNPSLPGAYLGLRSRHTRAHLLRAAVEGVCMQMRAMLDRLAAVTPVESVHATGGAFRSPLWRQILAAMLDRPLYVVGDADGTALGAAALGLYALGRAGTPSDALPALGVAGHPRRVAADADLTAAYDRLRASVPDLIRSLQEVAGLFDEPEASRAGGD